MQQQLYIARHAHAQSSSPDEQRPLSDKGQRQVQRLVRGLSASQLLGPSQIWHSGLARSAETAAALADGLSLNASLLARQGLAPYDDPTPIASQLNATEKTLLIVGHEPNLSALTSLLLSGNFASEHVVFGKAAMLCLARMKVATQATPWQIHWHISHKHFKYSS